MKQLDFNVKYTEIKNILKKEKSIVLCTSNGSKVAARTVYFVYFKDCIYFVTSMSYKKYKQIEKNQNVALCFSNIQIVGVASILGHPNLEGNKNILEYMEKNCSEMYKYVKYKNTVLIKVSIDDIEMWEKGGREYLNIENKTANRIG